MRHLSLLILLMTGLLCEGCQMPTGAAKAPDRAYLHTMLVKIAGDTSDTNQKRNVAESSHIGQNLPEGFWLAFFPPDATGERLLSEGKTLIVPDARLIAEDASENQAVRDSAAFYYGYFDEPWYLRWLAEKPRPTGQSQIDLWLALRSLLPTTPNELTSHEGLSQEWLKRQLENQPSFGELILTQFDKVMLPDLPSQKDGLVEQDPRLIKWFNHLNDVDIDAWLATHSPESAEYRKRKLQETGIDPLTAFGVYMRQGEREATIRQVLPPEEAVARLKLLNLVYPNNIEDPRKRPPQTDAKWRERVCAWYWAHRKEFRYDPALRRFLLPSETSQGR